MLENECWSMCTTQLPALLRVPAKKMVHSSNFLFTAHLMRGISRWHGKYAMAALSGLEQYTLSAQRILLGGRRDDTPFDTAATDPFAGVLPWELTTRASLHVPAGELEFGAALFEFAGVCHISEAVPPLLVEECRQSAEFHTTTVRAAVRGLGIEPDGPSGFRFHEACQRGPGRMDMRLLPPQAPFDDVRIHGSDAAWLPLVRRILGRDCTLLFQGLVVTEPGTPEQALHADGPHVPLDWQKYEPETAARASAAHEQHPCHCLTVFVPLVPLSAENGATSFLPGTHQNVLATAALDAEAQEAGSSSGAGTPVRLMLPAGDAILFDYRTFHAGGANMSKHRRPMLYLIYARPWFQDTFNFGDAALFPHSDGNVSETA